MPRDSAQKIFAGPRLRRLRRDLGLTQVQMAEGLDMSPAYLNLLERNQRPLSAQVLLKLADTYDVNLRGLTGEEGARTLLDLKEVFSDPLLEGIGVGTHELADLHTSSPTTAQALISLYRAYRSSTERISGLLEKIAGEVTNVKSVANEVQIAAITSLSARGNDSYITSKVKARFIDANKFSANHVKVVTEAGAVYLLGMVTRQEADDAVEVARTTGGVIKVVKLFEYLATAPK